MAAAGRYLEGRHVRTCRRARCLRFATRCSSTCGGRGARQNGTRNLSAAMGRGARVCSASADGFDHWHGGHCRCPSDQRYLNRSYPILWERKSEGRWRPQGADRGGGIVLPGPAGGDPSGESRDAGGCGRLRRGGGSAGCWWKAAPCSRHGQPEDRYQRCPGCELWTRRIQPNQPGILAFPGGQGRECLPGRGMAAEGGHALPIQPRFSWRSDPAGDNG